MIFEVKQQRSIDTRLAVEMGLSLLCGETISGNNLTSSFSKDLNINRRHLAMCSNHRMEVLSNWSVRWTLVKRRSTES